MTVHVNFTRYSEECLREGIASHIAVEVEALRPWLLRRRLDEAIEGLVDDVRRWDIEPAPKRPSESYCGPCKER
ncbi:hypothetical protein [Streptomyces sp. NPDC018000]|uniref:hypothetical protein n=1 Tax=Streptomyces sp. NPDC018000 TaxID=3365028 RepID=UPI0037AC11E9